MIARESTACTICGRPTEPVVELPALPLTGLYTADGPDANCQSHDQCLLLCETCGHGRLRYALDADDLYDKTYAFRTSASPTAARGSLFFADYIERLTPGRGFRRVLEFGCNDTHLLRLLAHRADRLVGVDPILRGLEEEFKTDTIEVVGDLVEAVDFDGVLGGPPDLIISQHTLEHLEDPRAVLQSLLRIATPDTLFVVEVPCFDSLLENYRFDHVFHQHLQYFSIRSFGAMLEQLGAELLSSDFNHLYWGAMLLAFRPGKPVPTSLSPCPTRSDIGRRYEVFQRSMQASRCMLEGLRSGPVYGYGAALMLPILGYHLGTDFSDFEAILDDDPDKDGLGYANLPVRIRVPRDIDYGASTICLTALDNRRAILKNLVEKRPRRIINPLGVL